jgi:hypothetical protein
MGEYVARREGQKKYGVLQAPEKVDLETLCNKGTA